MKVRHWTGPGLLGLALVFFWLTQPQTLDPSALIHATPDPVKGELLFHAASCAACHEENLRGGLELQTEFGTFRAPNISPDKVTGIGNWTDTDFINAMLFGVSPSGQHYYPAFPYTSYTRMSLQDVVDVKAYIDTLPAVAHEVAGPELEFPWNFRLGIGLWKRLYLDSSAVIELPDDADAELQRGRYLVEGPGHCAECHTERDAFGGLRTGRWLAGAPNPDGEGRIPNITPDTSGLGEWSAKDLAFYLETGMDPEFDSVGGSMVKVQENLARLSPEDRAAIVAYLRAVPALPESE
ncbi:MAG TPA: cytochrome c [Xanthomonadales bacterium]|nr:cytochrome c [Xanthomonadales bacterium]